MTSCFLVVFLKLSCVSMVFRIAFLWFSFCIPRMCFWFSYVPLWFPNRKSLCKPVGGFPAYSRSQSAYSPRTQALIWLHGLVWFILRQANKCASDGLSIGERRLRSVISKIAFSVALAPSSHWCLNGTTNITLMVWSLCNYQQVCHRCLRNIANTSNCRAQSYNWSEIPLKILVSSICQSSERWKPKAPTYSRREGTTTNLATQSIRVLTVR